MTRILNMEKQRLKQSGRSMIEMLAIIAILGLISTGVYNMANATMSQRRLINTVLEIHNIVAAIQKTFAWTDSYVVPEGIYENGYGMSCSYTGIEAYLICQGILSHNRLQLSSGNVVSISAVGKPIISPEENPTGPLKSTFTLTIPNVDYITCAAIMREDWGDRLESASGKSSLTYLPPLMPNELDTEACAMGSNVTIKLTFL